MVDWTSSAGRKLARGIEHVNTLCGETTDYENSNAYVLETKREIRSADEVSYRCVAIQRIAPPDHWSLLASEAVHHLRSALDSAVYAASNEADGTAFPIISDPGNFKRRERKMISRAPTEVQALIKARQPYAAMPDGPEWDALARLAVLSNRDKHRELSTVAAAVDQPYVGINDGDLTFTYAGIDQELGTEETEVMAFTMRGPSEDELHVDPHFDYQVRIEGQAVASTFVYIARRVFECVYEIQTAEAMPILTPAGFYPI